MNLGKVLEMPNGIEKARELAISGLLTDGSHHKQWYLERILEALGVNLKELRMILGVEDYDWEEGVAP